MSLTGRNTWSLVLLVFVSVSQVADVTDKYPNIKVRHGRYRRHDAEGYVPSSFVLDTNEPETGNWGPWSPASSCSRSCGGGVAHQSRQCLDVVNSGNNTCTGAKKRFFSCNIQECPSGSADFWAEQCSKFNDIEFDGMYYDWIPYTGGPNKCELNCMPRGDRFLYRPKFIVTDGTPCDFEKNDVCVEGRCMPVGCDMMLGSDAREDVCRECGGDGSSCNTVNGIFDTDVLQVGDIDALLIPQGATNVVVKEISTSNNYLAIRNATGYYYLNGNWRADFPLRLRFAGTIFHYATDPQGFSAPDTITALGPTSEDIYVVLLYQDRNVGVYYEYSVPKKFSQQRDPDSYTWVTDEFSECSKSCGGGYKSRMVKCVRRRDNEPADVTFCDPQLEPDATQNCGKEPCSPKWLEGGERTRQLKCEQIPIDGIRSISDDLRLCLETVGPKNDPSEKWKPEGKKPVTSGAEETGEDSPIDEDCVNSTYGCCEDSSTPAHGPNQEGCCLGSTFGCCRDNVSPARGADLYGCGCEHSRFRCCPDNSTEARGPDNEGCGCQFTPHGCCPNRFTPANGPNFEGCACYTYQFGCCSDGVAIARGPHGQGCGCENTDFKCCSDGRTPAQGANFAGCKCDASKFGCCLDGVKEAQGENFEGCLRVPSNPGTTCGLEKDRGSCTDYAVRWFFDTAMGGCSRFWYGGCGGNENRFETLEECKDVCVQPKGKGACHLPKISGPCEGYYPKWYYNSERNQCVQFVYTGCLGNGNRFETRDQCEELCSVSTDVDPCGQPKEVGLCEGNFMRWYFNKEGQACESFSYGGCKANENNYPTEVACHQQCLQPGQSRDSCSEPRDAGNCTEKHSRWFFDGSENRCMPFYYTGCGGNRNNFDSRDACESDCPPKIEQDICLLPALLGECANYETRWFYNSLDQQCWQFYYGGCGGNGNNFATEEDCAGRCEKSVSTPPSRATEFKRAPPVVAIEQRVAIKQPEETRVSAEEGGFVTLTCTATGNPKPTIVWRKNMTVIKPSEARRRILQDGSLQIVNLYDYDRGTYVCTADNGLPPPARIEYQLEIKEPQVRSSAIVGEPNATVKVRMNSSAELHCYAMGWPRPVVMWWREDAMLPLSSENYLQGSNYTLLIRTVTPTVLGVYTCQAYNGIQGPASWSVTLQAIRPVPVNVNVTTEKTEHSMGSNFIIECSVDGDPVPRVFWYKNGELVRTDDRIKISELKWQFISYSLQISNATSNDTGTYRCEAANEYSSGSASVDIRVDGPYIHPDCQDNTYFAKCDIIVLGKYCRSKYYARFCCRSCTEAGQLPLKEPHLEAAKNRRRRRFV